MDRLTEMEAFASVVAHGGFTVAAKKMGVSKSAISKHVSNLENRLGARLLNRTTRRVSPTEIGLAYYDRAKRVLSDAGEADALVSSMQRAPTGHLRISAATDFGVNHLSPVLGQFIDDFPDLKVELVLSNRQVELISESFDLAIRIGSMNDSSLRARRFAETTNRLVASPDYLLKHGRPERIDDLNKHKLLHYSHQGPGQVWHLKSFNGQQWNIRSDCWLSINDGQSLLNAAIAGVGIAYVPSYLYAPAMERGLVMDAMPAFRSERQGISAVFPPGPFTQPKVRAFIDFLVATFGKKAAEGW